MIAILRRMYDLLLLKLLCKIVYKHNLAKDDERSKDIKDLLIEIKSKSPVTKRARIENIDALELSRLLAKKRPFWIKKVGGAKANKILNRATHQDYLVAEPSKNHSYNRVYELTDKGEKHRTLTGFIENAHIEFPNLTKTLVAGGALVFIFSILQAVIKLMLQ